MFAMPTGPICAGSPNLPKTNHRLAGRPTDNGFVLLPRSESGGLFPRSRFQAGNRSAYQPTWSAIQRNRIGRRTASGSRSPLNRGTLRFALCLPPAAMPPCWRREKIPPGLQIPGRWSVRDDRAGTTSCLCLTRLLNKSRMFPGPREVVHNHNPVGLDSPSTKDKT